MIQESRKMAQTTSYISQHHQGYPAHQQPGSAFVVVDQQPVQREVFPYRLQLNWLLGFSIGKIILGSLLFITGIANVVIIRYDTQIAIGVWCGLTVGSDLTRRLFHTKSCKNARVDKVPRFVRNQFNFEYFSHCLRSRMTMSNSLVLLRN